MKAMTTQEWFAILIEELKAIIVEAEFTSRWVIVECYHNLGQRISQENNNFKRAEIYGKRICSTIAKSLGKSERTIYQALQFYKKYPDLNKLPEGKNVSWSRVCKFYLPEGKREKKPCQHEPIVVCRKCGEKLDYDLALDKEQ